MTRIIIKKKKTNTPRSSSVCDCTAVHRIDGGVWKQFYLLAIKRKSSWNASVWGRNSVEGRWGRTIARFSGNYPFRKCSKCTVSFSQWVFGVSVLEFSLKMWNQKKRSTFSWMLNSGFWNWKERKSDAIRSVINRWNFMSRWKWHTQNSQSEYNN